MNVRKLPLLSVSPQIIQSIEICRGRLWRHRQQQVEHSPVQDNFPDELEGKPWNQSHCSIIGDAEERRVRMIDIAKWEISPPEYTALAE